MLSSGIDIKEKLLRQYDQVTSITDNCSKLPANLREPVEKLREKLIKKRKELSEEFCQLVVSGKLLVVFENLTHTRKQVGIFISALFCRGLNHLLI